MGQGMRRRRRDEDRARLRWVAPSAALAVAALLVGCAGHGSWTTEVVPVPPNPAGAATTVAMEQVECDAADMCVAVGAVRTADGTRVATWRRAGATWSAPIVRPATSEPLTDVSCASASFCVATGRGGVERWDGRSWSPATVAGTGQRVPGAAVACAGPDFCLAVAPGGTMRWDGHGWQDGGSAPATTGSLTAAAFRALSCPVPGLCVAIGNEPGSTGPVNVEHVWRNGAWARRTFPTLPAGTFVDDLACDPTERTCLVVGRHPDRPGGVAYGGGDGIWTDLDLPALASTRPLGVECTAASTCVVLAPDAAGALRRGGGWSTGPTPPPPSTLDVACRPGWCLAVGGELTPAGELLPVAAVAAH